MTLGQRALVALAIYILVTGLLVTVGPYSRVAAQGGRLGPPEERPGVSPAAVSIFLGRIGDEGRRLYTRALILDCIVPALFAVAGVSIVAWARQRRPRPALPTALVARLVILTVAAELIENLLLLVAVSRHPSLPLLGGLIGTVVSFKLVLVVATSVGLAVISVLAGMRSAPSPS